MTITVEQGVHDAGSTLLTVALMNDYEVVVRGLARMLGPYSDRVRVAELDVNLTPGQSVDITLYDTFAVPQTDNDTIDALIADPVSGRVVVYSWTTQPELVRAGLAQGIAGYLPKTLAAEDLVAALQRVHAGEEVVIAADKSRDPDQDGDPDVDITGPGARQSWPGRDFGLTPRESEMIVLITQGLSNTDIATRCYLSVNTIKTYIRTAYRKMGVDTRARAVAWGMTHGMAPDHVRRTPPRSTSH